MKTSFAAMNQVAVSNGSTRGSPTFFGDYYGSRTSDFGQPDISPSGFAGSLSSVQRERMLAALTPSQLAAYNAMTPTQKAAFESDFADAHWDIVSGTNQQAANQAQYFATADHALNLTAGTISTAIANAHSERLAELNNAAQIKIAEIQAQLQRDLAPSQATALQAQLVAMQAAQAQIAAAQQQSSNRTMKYVFGGLAVLTVLGVGYLATRNDGGDRHNPVVIRNGRRKFIPMHLLRKGW